MLLALTAHSVMSKQEMQQLRAELQIQLANISRIDIDSRRQELESLRETNAGAILLSSDLH